MARRKCHVTWRKYHDPKEPWVKDTMDRLKSVLASALSPKRPHYPLRVSIPNKRLLAFYMVLLGMLPAIPNAGAQTNQTFERPNILVVVTDDQRADLRVMPRLKDWLGEGGTRFSKAFVTTPICCPSRASIMTGQYVHNHGVESNGPDDWHSLEPATTIQSYLQNAGYQTAIFGKYLNWFPVDRDPPHFDRWATFCCTPNVAHDAYYGGQWNINGEVRTTEVYSTDLIARKATRFIRNSSSPWFAYLAPTAPHAPFIAEPKYRDAAVPQWKKNPAVGERNRSDKPPYVQTRWRSPREAKVVRAKQMRTLMSVDDLMADLRSALKDTEQARDTLVVFTSDNGYLWGEHGLQGKAVPYIHSVKVPLLLRWPGHLSSGADDPRLAANIDIAPTVLDAAGVTAPIGMMDGNSLLQEWNRDRLLMEVVEPIIGIPAWAGELTTTEHYVEYYDDIGRVTFREYYDRLRDPHELKNLFHTALPDTSALAGQLAADRQCAGPSCP